MVRRLASLPAMTMVVIAMLVVTFGLGLQQPANVGMVIALDFGLGALLVILAGVRRRRLTAWTRGELPGEFRNAPSAWAVITSVRASEERYHNQPVMRFRVQVHALEGAFNSLMEVALTGRRDVRFGVGEVYAVRYRPRDHSLVAYDTTPAAASLGPKPSASTLPDFGALAVSAYLGLGAPAAEPDFIVNENPLAGGTGTAPPGYEGYPSNQQSVIPGLAQPLPPEVEAIMQEMFADRLSGKAVVKAQRVTGQQRGPLAEVQLDLTITPQAGAPFDTTITKWLPLMATGRLQPGMIVDVSYSPSSPSEMSILLTSMTTTSTELLG